MFFNPLAGLVGFTVTVLLPLGIIVLVLYCIWKGREARLREEGGPRPSQCPRCGERLRAGTLICTYCGTIQPEARAQRNATTGG
jgi:hypothetical protein